MAVDSSDGKRDHMPVFGGDRGALHGSMQKASPPSGPLLHPVEFTPPPYDGIAIRGKAVAQAKAAAASTPSLTAPSVRAARYPQPPIRPLPAAKNAKAPRKNK